MTTLLIDGITNATLSNGLIRLEVATVSSDGSTKPAGEIAIPANQYASVIQAMQTAGKQLKEQYEQKQQEKGEQPQTQAAQEPTPETAGDELDFSHN